MKKREELCEGWDARAVVYDDKEDKNYNAAIWKLLLLIFSLTLFLTAYLHVGELILYFTGKTVTGTYEKQYQAVTVTDENGGRTIVHVPGAFVASHDGMATLYYTGEDIKEAKPMTAAGFWLFSYGFSGGIDALSVWKLYKIYGKKRDGI